MFIIVKPRIDRTNLKPIVVRAGKLVKYDIDVRGEPPPEIKWYHVDNEVKSGENIEIVNIDYNTKLTISDSLRKNTGLWKIKAVNPHGEDEAEVEITILCEYEINYEKIFNCIFLFFKLALPLYLFYQLISKYIISFYLILFLLL